MTINVDDWSETPASNATIDSVSIAENCTPGGINNAIRAVMAGVKTFKLAYTTLATSIAALMPKAAGVFTGTQPVYTGEGAMLHNAAATGSSGKVHVLPEGTTPPALSNGDMVFFYTP